MNKRIASLLPVAILSLSLHTSLASAADRTVDASDLDLRDPADATILYERIKVAAAMVCRSDSASWDSSKQRNLTRCKKAVIDDAVARFNQPLLTAVHHETFDKVAKN